MKFMMNTGRTITQGRHIESKGGIAYSEETSSCYINPIDLLELGIEEGENVQLTGTAGSVVMKAALSEDVLPGMVFIPYGPFANFITPPETHSTGMPDFKNIIVDILPTEESRSTALDLMEKLGGLRYEGR